MPSGLVVPERHLRLELSTAVLAGVDEAVWKVGVFDVVPGVFPRPRHCLAAHLTHEPTLFARQIFTNICVQVTRIAWA